MTKENTSKGAWLPGQRWVISVERLHCLFGCSQAFFRQFNGTFFFRDQNVFMLVIGNVIFFRILLIKYECLNRSSVHQCHLPRHFPLHLAMNFFLLPVFWSIFAHFSFAKFISFHCDRRIVWTNENLLWSKIFKEL